MSDRLKNLADAGVSIWLDDLSRDRLDSGNLADLVATRSVTGVTTNPTIFAAALSRGSAYDSQVAELADQGYRLIVTTGGTGLTPTDRTAEATSAIADRLVPGIPELMRTAGVAITPTAALSRGVVAARGATLIVNVPGSPGGAIESLDAALPVLRHAVDQLRGGDHH